MVLCIEIWSASQHARCHPCQKARMIKWMVAYMACVSLLCGIYQKEIATWIAGFIWNSNYHCMIGNTAHSTTVWKLWSIMMGSRFCIVFVSFRNRFTGNLLGKGFKTLFYFLFKWYTQVGELNGLFCLSTSCYEAANKASNTQNTIHESWKASEAVNLRLQRIRRDFSDFF